MQLTYLLSREYSVVFILQVIDVNHLIVRLAVDTSKSVIQRLVVLLAPYYHPKDSTPDVIFKRCLSLVIVNFEELEQL